MKFKAEKRPTTSEYEQDLVKYWKDHKVFEKSIQNRPADNAYVFYDGPPFITGSPHHGTLLSSIVKDAVARFWTMQGKRVERVWGWDCHGLPAEVFTEKKLGIQDRRDIGTKISLEEYITTCRDNMIQTGNLWEDTIDRIGRWVDFKGAYKTMDKEYMESVWWAFKELYGKGKIYEGEKVLLYCTRDATPISKAEVAMDNSYQDVTDPSVYVLFKLKNPPKNLVDSHLLAWTTTPWTLPANTAVAVNNDHQYSQVLVDGKKIIIATDRLAQVLTNEKHQPIDHQVLGTLKGSELVGLSYEPIFEDRSSADNGHNAHKIWHADYVSTEDGTGIVHLAPAYGEEDFELARNQSFPIVSNIDDSGFYTSGNWKGQYVWDVNKPIAKELHAQGVIWKIEYIKHSYPHCHRCGTKLMYRAHPSWFMDIEGQREQMLETNGDINWFPNHIKHGRFEKTVMTAPDWNISRDRFWATAMPVWKGKTADGRELTKVIGSYQELKELSGIELDDYHRPWVDDVTFEIDGVSYKRIDKVLDCWFESGSMPFAQFHYPFENVDKFEQNFPGDFIAEYVPQVRAWFYYLHAVSIGLFGRRSYTNVVVTGTIAGNDGRKMSKSFGNYTDPNELMDKYGADPLRFLLLGSPLLNAEDFSLLDKDVADVGRKLNMVWNMYDFFTMYAEVDEWEYTGELSDPAQEVSHVLDKWIISRVHQLGQEVEENLKNYDLPNAIKPILPFIDDASNWYVRRSRRRFWKNGTSADKNDAYKTLHYVLVRLCTILAPITPFMAEELYKRLTGASPGTGTNPDTTGKTKTNEGRAVSVHWLDWPKTGHVNDTVVANMALVRQVINDGLSQRAQAGVKVRQPLQSVKLLDANKQLDSEMLEIIKEELNVKEVITHQKADAPAVVINLNLTPELKQEGLMREIVRHVQSSRKQAGLQIDDRIKLSLSAPQEVLAAAEAYSKVIQEETLAKDMDLSHKTYSFSAEVKVDGHKMTVSLQKAD